MQVEGKAKRNAQQKKNKSWRPEVLAANGLLIGAGSFLKEANVRIA